jgi:hypothetical protein
MVSPEECDDAGPAHYPPRQLGVASTAPVQVALKPDYPGCEVHLALLKGITG